MRRVVAFFALAFAISWAILLPEALAERGVLPSHLPTVVLGLAGFGPAVAAVVMALLERGGALRDLFSRLLRVRVSMVWYVVALLGPALVLLGGRGLERLLGGTPPPVSSPPMMVELGFAGVPPLLFLLALFVNNLIMLTGEELGWRGYALPRLQTRFSALASGLVLGILWGLWHLPLALTPATRSALAELPLWAFLVDITAMSVIYVWVFNNTRGSVFIALVLHAANNAAAVFLMPVELITTRQFLLTVAVRIAVAVVLVLLAGAERLSRGSVEEATYEAPSLASRA